LGVFDFAVEPASVAPSNEAILEEAKETGKARVQGRSAKCGLAGQWTVLMRGLFEILRETLENAELNCKMRIFR
jgi:hypothetical protein